MGTVLTVMNMKGGVGKTTVSIYLAGMAAREKLGREEKSRVLLIDYDPQFNASQSYLPSRVYFDLEKEKKTILSVLMDDPEKIDPFTLQVTGQFPPPKVDELSHTVFRSGVGILDIIPSTINLMYVALGQPNRSMSIIKERFSEFIRQAKRKYDLVIIDCHPAGSVFTQTSLSTSDHVLIPVKPQNYAVRGLGLMKRFIDGRGPQAPAITPHILFNHVESGPRSPEETQIRASREFAPLCLRHNLKKWKHLTVQSEGRDFVWDRPVRYQPEALQNLREVCSEVMGRIMQ
jgi:chromosome partitioning protein